MIRKIQIENFKSIHKGEINIKSLNVFTGINGSGKSSFIQSLLVLRQSFLAGNLIRKPISISFGGDSEKLVNLGTFKDVICQQAKKGDEKIKFEIQFEKKTLSFSSLEYTPDNRDLNVVKGKLNGDIFEFQDESLFSNNFQYLAAERIQPEEDFPRFQNNELLGKRGEFTAHFLEKYGAKDIPIKNLSLTNEPQSYSLINQTNYWLGVISESIEVNTNENLTTNRIELTYRYKMIDGTPTQNQKPQNVGFGITHTLPILVAILSANPKDIIIIENPESHLHPKGQAKLAQLFAKAAQNGVQLIIETHSDHIINGLRVAVRKKVIDREHISLNYFSKSQIMLSNIVEINVQQEGGLDNWPDGFFDEWENQLSELL